MIFNVFSSVVYCIIYNYICADYLCCPQTKLHVNSSNKLFENTTYNSVSGICIHELLMNIISCNGFLNGVNSAGILSCRTKSFSYDISIGSIIHENNSSTLNNLHQRVKQRINSEHIYKNDFAITRSIAIHYGDNTLKSITMCSGLYTYFSSTYYNDRGCVLVSFLENISSRILSKLIILR